MIASRLASWDQRKSVADRASTALLSRANAIRLWVRPRRRTGLTHLVLWPYLLFVLSPPPLSQCCLLCSHLIPPFASVSLTKEKKNFIHPQGVDYTQCPLPRKTAERTMPSIVLLTLCSVPSSPPCLIHSFVLSTVCSEGHMAEPDLTHGLSRNVPH